MISSASAAITILRQGLFSQQDSENKSDDIINIYNRNKLQGAARENARSVLTQLSIDTAESEPDASASESEIVHVVPGGGVYVTLPNGSPTYEQLRARTNINKSADAQMRASARIVEATTLRLAENDSAWQKAVDSATQRFRDVVSDVIATNARFHTLDHIDASKTSLSYFEVFGLNCQIDTVNRLKNVNMARPISESTLKDHGINGRIDTLANGELRISAFQISSEDGRLVAELRENGHFVTYNSDGSVWREMDRSDVCAEMSRGMWTGKLAALVYSEDKDLMFY